MALPIRELSEQSQERLEQLDKTVALKLEGKSSEALDYLQSGVGKVTMDKIREVTTNMEGELKKKILESDRESTSAYFNAIVLDVSRIGRHKITLNRIQLAMIETIEHLIEDYRQAQSNRVIEFDRSEIRSELFAFADKTRIVQSVTNLLHNACKFSQEDQPIQVRVTRDRASTDQIAISVTDLGTGLEPCDLDEIFLLFHQSNVTIDRSQGGLGIGLTLAKGLVEMHGGTIRAASRGLGHGSTFTINLPLAELQAMRSQNDNLGAGRTSVSQSKPKYRILAIDDWMDALLPLRVLITKAGHDFAEAKDGQSGFDMAVVYSPDIVLCDIGLPGSMNGLDVARKFRLHATLRSAYMVALSGYSQPSDHVKSAEAGFDFHVAKPINARVLNDLIDARPRFPKATSNSIQA